MMCDWCSPVIGDHDKAYQFGRPDLLRLRLTHDELRCLTALRRHIRDVLRAGYTEGPGSGDLAPDPREEAA
jgi:hypothetical protein